ncbi:hypothetical protein ABW20_dc0104944 [Dactylellina cionopaga]|nr:hypothetical protein ABW20_dc0104944 [Dactylellina cionopaga]
MSCKGVAIIVDDTIAHTNATQALSETDKMDILAVKTQEQDKAMLANQEESRRRKEIAIENAKASGKWKTKPSRIPEAILPRAKLDSLFSVSSPGEPESTGAGASDEGTSRGHQISSEDNALRQYIVPMTSSLIGKHSLRDPHESGYKPNPPLARYDVYRFLQRLGYFLSPGLRFGCQFVAYPGDPLRFHSHFLVKSLRWDEELSILDLVGGGRLGTGVKKAWMMAGEVRNSPETEEKDDETRVNNVRVFCVEWGGFG